MKVSEATYAVVDTETSGLDPQKDRIVEFALLDTYGYSVDFLVNPGIPIPPETSAVHHIIDADVAGALPYDEAMKRIERVVMPSYVVCAHNAAFDRSFLPCVEDRTWLCTQRLARHLLPDSPGHSNQVLRYVLGGAKLDLKGLAPHRAMADVIVTSFVLKALLRKYLAAGKADDVDALIAFAESPIRLKTINFGKHKGSAFAELPLDYIQWALSPRGMTDMEADMRYTFECELKDRGTR